MQKYYFSNKKETQHGGRLYDNFVKAFYKMKKRKNIVYFVKATDIFIYVITVTVNARHWEEKKSFILKRTATEPSRRIGVVASFNETCKNAGTTTPAQIYTKIHETGKSLVCGQ